MATGAGAVTGRGAVPYIFGGATYACVCKSKCKVIYFIFYLLVQRFVPLACRAIRFVVDCCYYCRKKKKKLQGTKITAAQSRAFPVPPNTRSNELVHVHSPGAPVFLLGPPENNSTSWTDDDDAAHPGRTTTTDTGTDDDATTQRRGGQADPLPITAASYHIPGAPSSGRRLVVFLGWGGGIDEGTGGTRYCGEPGYQERHRPTTPGGRHRKNDAGRNIVRAVYSRGGGNCR